VQFHAFEILVLDGDYFRGLPLSMRMTPLERRDKDALRYSPAAAERSGQREIF